MILQVIKSKLILTLLGLIIAGALAFYFQTQRLNEAKDNYSVAAANEKAALKTTLIWQDKYEQQHSRNQQFDYTVAEFKNSQDSTTRKLYEQILLNRKNIKNMIQASYTKTVVDTVLQAKLELAIPDTTIDLSNKQLTNIISFKRGVLYSKVRLTNEQYVYWESKNETIKPRRKFFIRRWFQQKHTITEVEVINSNPLVITEKQKFILNKDNQKKAGSK